MKKILSDLEIDLAPQRAAQKNEVLIKPSSCVAAAMTD